MTRREIQVREYERSTGLVQSHSREQVSGPNTRWLLPESHGQPPAELIEASRQLPTAYDPAFTSHENSGSEEYATPISRAQGQVIRLIPLSIVWILLSGGIVTLAGLGFPHLFILFAILTAITYWRMNLDEFKHSRNGLERHKVDSAVTVRLAELDQAHELRKMALEGYLAQLNGDPNP